MADVIPHWTNRGLRSVWMLDNSRITVDVMSVDVSAVGTKVADGISGELRTRNQFILDHYEIKLVIQQQKLEAIKAVLKWQANIDGFAIPLNSALGLVITFNDGDKDTAVAQDITIDDWALSMPGRSDRNQFTLPLRANIFKTLST